MNYEAWCHLLPINDPKRESLLKGVREGFHIVDDITECNISDVHMENYKSATCKKIAPIVELQIKDEIVNGQYKIVNKRPALVSALGAIPKKEKNKIRLIHDCSRPPGYALNDFAESNSMKYQSLQDAIDLIGQNYYIAKVDLANAYRVVRIHPSNYDVTGLKWTFTNDSLPTYMVDTRLPFGARRSPEIFNELTQAVRRIMAQRGSQVVAYLDDFLIVGESKRDCANSMNDLMCVLLSLGFRINYNKVEGPVKRLTFLGIVLNTEDMTMSLPQERLDDLDHTLKSVLYKSKVTKKGLQSLAGKLSWATQCVYGGRFHLRRLFEKISSLRRPWHRTRITNEMKSDILWWLSFMHSFNGNTKMVDNCPAEPVCIDACSEAAGAYYNGECLYTRWKSVMPWADSLHINFKEVLALEPAVHQWAPYWCNKKVFVHCDNQAAVSIINKGSCNNSVVMNSLRTVFWLSVMYNFRLKAVYYTGRFNKIADSVSRLHEPGGLSRLYKCFIF